MLARPRRNMVALAALALCLLSLATATAAGAASEVTRSTASLSAKLTRLFADAGSSTSGLVVDETTHRTLFSLRAGTLRLPASVEKLYTTSTALLDFGPDYRFETDVYGVGSTTDGHFTGTLYLKGGGDPTFGDAVFDTPAYGTGATGQTLARSLLAAGIHAVTGEVVGDGTIFDSLGGGPDTGYHANTETEGELSGLSWDAGWTSAAEVALQPSPVVWATKSFVIVAREAGVNFARGIKVVSGSTPADAKLLARISSPTVGTLVALTNAPSDNFFAETLLKDEGHFYGAGGTTADGAATVIDSISARLGISPITDDGSGLSRYDHTSATQIVELLEEMQAEPSFVSSLAVAGLSGTMVDEMLHTPAVNNCRGKTGTLNDVANLVGYCTAANGDQLVFAFLQNGLSDSDYGHRLEDLMGEALAEYDGSGSGAAAPTLPVPSPSYTPITPAAAPSSATTSTTPATTTSPGSGAGNGGGGL